MSMEIHVLCLKDRLPDLKTWQAAIEANGFEMKLDPSGSVSNHKGFLLAKFRGGDSGFGFDLGAANDVYDAYEKFKDQFIGFDCTANFCWGGDLIEMSCVMAASAVLAKLCEGIWFDPQEAKCLDGASAIEHAKTEIEASKQWL